MVAEVELSEGLKVLQELEFSVHHVQEALVYYAVLVLYQRYHALPEGQSSRNVAGLLA